MLQELHHGLGAHFGELNGAPIVKDYGDVSAEYAAVRGSAGVLDLSFRSRICLIGADRARYLHGQVTNDVKRLNTGEGCYTAITTAKGKMESDANVFNLGEELLLDFEPGLTAKITARLDKFIVADDVQIVDAAPHYGLLSVLGPKANAVVQAIGLFSDLPAKNLSSVKISDATLGDIYLMNNPRLGASPSGFDLFVPNNSLGAVTDKLIAAAKQTGGRAIGFTAFEIARIEAGIPRFGADMDETNIPLECGIESRSIVYNKGCYIGQETINRIHSIGHVTRELRGLRLPDGPLPARGEKLFHAGKEVGYLTSTLHSPALNANIALGYVRYEVCQLGNELQIKTASGEQSVKIVPLPFI